MTRSPSARVLVLVLALAGTASAQCPGVTRLPGEVAILDRVEAKELARAKFAASRADVRELARAKAEAARVESEERFKEFLAGRGTLDILLESLGVWMNSERERLGPDADPTPLLELYWAQTRVVEALNERRYENGRVSYKEYLETRYERLGAELDLIRLRTKKGRMGRSGPLPVRAYFFLLDLGAFAERILVQARFEARSADPARLAGARLEAAQGAYASRLKEFLAGRGSLDILLEGLSRWAEAERGVSGAGSEMAFLTAQWETAWLIDNTNRARYEAHHLPPQDYLQSTYYRLGVELRLAELRAERKHRGAGRPRLVVFLDLPDDQLNTKELARAQFDAAHARRASLLRQRYEAARDMHAARLMEFLAGGGSLDLLVETSRLLLEAQTALARSDADRLAAVEQYWEYCTLTEDVNRRRYEAGRIPLQDYMQTRRARLQAEMWLVEARTGKPAR